LLSPLLADDAAPPGVGGRERLEILVVARNNPSGPPFPGF